MTSYNACYKKIREGSKKRLRGRGRAGSAEIQKSIVAFFILGAHAMKRVGYSGLLVSFVLGLSMSEVGCVLILVKSQHCCFSVPVWLQLRHYKSVFTCISVYIHTASANSVACVRNSFNIFITPPPRVWRGTISLFVSYSERLFFHQKSSKYCGAWKVA